MNAEKKSMLGRWYETVRGSEWFMLFPVVAMLVVALSEAIGFPKLLVSAFVIVGFCYSFFRLVRIQYSRRQSNADVFVAFVQAALIAFVSFAIVGIGLFWLGQSFFM